MSAYEFKRNRVAPPAGEAKKSCLLCSLRPAQSKTEHSNAVHQKKLPKLAEDISVVSNVIHEPYGSHSPNMRIDPLRDDSGELVPS